MNEDKDNLAADVSLCGELSHGVSMAEYNTWRSGGLARRFYKPADVDDLSVFLSALPADEALLWLGLGSNMLVRDGGFAGTVIATQGVLGDVSQLDAFRFEVGAGVACNKVARRTAKAGLLGAEFLAGIPGTMGGALAMNAGAFGGETWPLVESVKTMDHQGVLRVRQASEFDYSYRCVKTQRDRQEWFVSCVLKLGIGDADAAREDIKKWLAKRNQSQPTGEPSCGSVFRNPEGDYAARLIESAGMKGVCRGRACVSEKHSNFIINTGGALAADIEALLMDVQAEVKRQHGVMLQPEVFIVGDPS